MRFRKTVAIDFDGVLHQHVSPWTVAHEIHDGPVPGAFEFLEQVLDEFNVVIFSARAADPEGRAAIKNWLFQHWYERSPSHDAPVAVMKGVIEITAQKPHAFIYIDDRGWHFEGRFPTMDEIRSFESWTKRAALPLDRRARISMLEEQRQDLFRKMDAVAKEVNQLWLEDLKESHPCPCVRENKRIEVFNMGDAERNRRQTFGIGRVAELISADKDCALCGGTGRPKEAAT